MKEIKNTKVIEEILYESEDGKLQSKNRGLVEDYENALKLKGDLKSFEINRVRDFKQSFCLWYFYANDL